MCSTDEVAKAVHLLSDDPRRAHDLPHPVGTALARDDALGSDTEPLIGQMQEYTVTEAARRIGASVKATQQEVDRLVAAGFLADRRHGNNALCGP